MNSRIFTNILFYNLYFVNNKRKSLVKYFYNKFFYYKKVTISNILLYFMTISVNVMMFNISYFMKVKKKY